MRAYYRDSTKGKRTSDDPIRPMHFEEMHEIICKYSREQEITCTYEYSPDLKECIIIIEGPREMHEELQTLLERIES